MAKLPMATSPKIRNLLILLACIVFAIPIVGYTLNGSYMRYSGDDYCDTARLVKYGFWGAFKSYYLNEGGRFSGVLLAEVIGTFEPKVNGVLPGLVILLWLGSLAYTIRMGAKFTSFAPSWLEILLGSEFLIFMTLYQAPDLPQDLYWRTGMLAYLFPLVLTTFVAALVLNFILRERVSPYALLLVAFLAFLAGGFSESAVALNGGLWALAFLSSWIIRRIKIDWASNAIWYCGSALVGTLIAVLIIFIAPGNAVRQLHDNWSRTLNPLLITSLSFQFTWNFIRGSLLGMPIPVVLSFIYPALLVFFLASRASITPWRFDKQKIVKFLLMPVACYLLMMCSMAPSVFAYTLYPEPRVLLLARFMMVIPLIGMGCLVGYALAALFQRLIFKPSHVVLGIFFLLLCGSSIYPVYATRKILAVTPLYQKWASFWDARDQEIRLDKQKGILDVAVVKIDHVIPWVGELSPDSGYWYNRCAAQYYGVNSISANKPGWNK